MNQRELESIADDVLFREAGARMRKLFFREYGVPFEFGCFELVFHQGALQWIEERPRYRRYLGKRPKYFLEVAGAEDANT